MEGVKVEICYWYESDGPLLWRGWVFDRLWPLAIHFFMLDIGDEE
jgi:hypothetical protein